MVEEELEPLITQCPNCQTRFRVTETQLQIARGSVRCGSCLTVFPGIDHLLWLDTEGVVAEVDAQEALDQLLDELGPEDEPDDSTDPLASARKDGGFDAEETPATPPPIADTLFDVEDVWLNEKSQLYAGYEVADAVDDAAGSQAASEQSPESHWMTPEPMPESAQLQDAEPVLESADAEFSLAPLEPESELGSPDTPDTVDSLDFQPPTAPADPVAQRPPPTRSDASAITGVYSTFVDDFGFTEPAAAEGEAVADAVVPELSRSATLADLPESISFAPEPRRWWTPLIILIGLSALVAEIFWFQFEGWSRDPAIRPIYSVACGWLDCQLPVLRDVKKMSTRNLVVRSHPDLSGALIVDAVIVNGAEFTQPFPVLYLRFTSIDGNLVAGRHFQPAEYLSGELLGSTQMAPLTPIRIELQIEDPGSEAVNYFLNFR